MKVNCVECGKAVASAGSRGRTKRFCSQRCQKRDYRRRKAAASTAVFPARMTSVDRWVRAQGKRPMRATGGFASSTNPRTWSSFEAVQVSTVGNGFGVMLGDGLACVDVDDGLGRDGRLVSGAREVVASLGVVPLFVERSVSGDGVHIFFEAPEQDYRRVVFDGGVVEVFYRDRFMLTTGDVVGLGWLMRS